MLNNLKESIDHGDLLFPVDIRQTKQKAHEEIMLYCHWHEEDNIC